MSNRADRYTVETKKIEYYSDFLVNLDKNPLTGYLARVTNEDSVRQSIKTILLTKRTERFYRPWIGSKLNALLFDLAGSSLDSTIEAEVKTTIENAEPRAKIEAVQVSYNQNSDTNTINVRIVFSIRSIPNQTYNLDILLRRVR